MLSHHNWKHEEAQVKPGDLRFISLPDAHLFWAYRDWRHFLLPANRKEYFAGTQGHSVILLDLMFVDTYAIWKLFTATGIWYALDSDVRDATK